MLRQAAFQHPEKAFLKGGLHCHTTRSDGAVPPDEVIRLHARNGYDFLALTDHRRYNFRNFAPEAGVLIIPGMEMDRTVYRPHAMCFHTVSIGPEEGKGNGFSQDQTFESGTVKDQFEYQSVVDSLRAAGNLVIYCHPDWSCTPYTSFDRLKGCFAMEIWNSGCVVENGMDSNAYCWDDLLREGVKIWGVATDDGHSPAHHCRGWVRVAADKTVDDVLRALEAGEFYASCGPEIFDFFVDDGNVTVKCSPASRIRIITGTRPTAMKTGEGLTEMTAPLREGAFYVRAEITDGQGRMAWTNPIYLDAAE